MVTFFRQCSTVILFFVKYGSFILCRRQILRVWTCDNPEAFLNKMGNSEKAFFI
jgi:hypothetical protein